MLVAPLNAPSTVPGLPAVPCHAPPWTNIITGHGPLPLLGRLIFILSLVRDPPYVTLDHDRVVGVHEVMDPPELLEGTEELLTEATELLERAEELLLETTELLEGAFPSEDELGVSPLKEELEPTTLSSDDDETSATARDELDGSPPSLLSDEQERVNIVASTTPAVNQTNLSRFILLNINSKKRIR